MFMAYFVIIRGPAGVGKTTLAKKLAQKIKGEVIHFDKVLRENGMKYVPGEKWVPEHHVLRANSIVLSHVKNCLEHNKNVIFEGNFYHLSQIEDLMEKLPYPHYIFSLHADVNVCILRDMKREGVGEQRVKDVYGLVNEYGDVIDTNNTTVDEVLNILLQKLA